MTTKLTQEQRQEILHRYQNSDEKVLAIAADFGIHPNWVYMIGRLNGAKPRKPMKLTEQDKHEIVCLMAFSKFGPKRVSFWYGIHESYVRFIHKRAICHHLRVNRSQRSRQTSLPQTMTG